MAIQFTDATAKEAIESGKPVVIDFWATWCGPCIKLGPIVEELAEKYEDKAIIGKLNIDDNDEIAAAHRVRNIPTVLFFKDGELKDRSVGLVKLSDLEAKLCIAESSDAGHTPVADKFSLIIGSGDIRYHYSFF